MYVPVVLLFFRRCSKGNRKAPKRERLCKSLAARGERNTNYRCSWTPGTRLASGKLCTAGSSSSKRQLHFLCVRMPVKNGQQVGAFQRIYQQPFRKCLKQTIISVYGLRRYMNDIEISLFDSLSGRRQLHVHRLSVDEESRQAGKDDRRTTPPHYPPPLALSRHRRYRSLPRFFLCVRMPAKNGKMAAHFEESISNLSANV